MRRDSLIKSVPRWALILGLGSLATASLNCQSSSTAPPDPEALAVLFIGNSLTYSNNLPNLLKHLLEVAQDDPVHIEAVAFPDYGLPDHWVSGSSRDRLASGGWDVVILQQGPSATEGRPYLLDYTELFDQEIRAQGGRTALYMVWPARSRFFDFAGVLDSYRTAADEVGGIFFPAGEAWRVAWETDPDLEFYGSDGFHPTLLGSYIAAVVMMERLTGYDPRELPPVIQGSGGAVQLDPEVATLIHGAAAEANRRFPDGG